MARRKDRPAAGSSLHGPAANGVSASGSSVRGSSVRASRSGGPTRGGSAQRGSSAAGRDPSYTRPALAPSLLAAVGLVACLALIDSGAFVAVRWGVTVLALIVLVFAVRGRTWWAAVLTATIAVLWNPVLTIGLAGELWAALQPAAAAVFVVVGIVVKVPREAESHRASRPTRQG